MSDAYRGGGRAGARPRLRRRAGAAGGRAWLIAVPATPAADLAREYELPRVRLPDGNPARAVTGSRS